MKLRVTALVFALSLLPQGVRADPAADYAAAQALLKQLKALPEEKRQFRHNWQKTIDQFKAVAESWPKSPLAEKALYEEGELYLELHEISRLHKDLESGEAAFQELEKRYPNSSLADDALHEEAKVADILGHKEQEAALLQEILDRYPKGDMVGKAKKELAALKAAGISPTAVATTLPSATPIELAAAPSPTPLASPLPNPSLSPAASSAPGQDKGPLAGGEAGDARTLMPLPKVWSNKDYTRVAVYLNGPVHWELHQIKQDGEKPPRIYVDLTRAKVGEEVKSATTHQEGGWEMKIEDGLLTRARIAQFNPDTVRVVLDVASMRDFTVSQLDDPFRLLIDVDGAGKVAEPVASPTPAPVAGASPIPSDLVARAKASERVTGYSLSEQLSLKFTRIYVDAGHGGNDPGARGLDGTQEKDVTLSIAKLLRAELEQLGYQAILTRKDDTFLPLEDRTAIANQGNGSFFVSIHCNAKDPTSRFDPSGVETYYADLPSDRASARLAAIENATNPESTQGLGALLTSLIRHDDTIHSAELALAVQKHLAADEHTIDAHIRDYGVKSALFYVLLTARMPAILVETSFLSNRRDEKHLADPKFQKALADSIAHAIDGYITSKSMKLAGGATPVPTASP